MSRPSTPERVWYLRKSSLVGNVFAETWICICGKVPKHMVSIEFLFLEAIGTGSDSAAVVFGRRSIIERYAQWFAAVIQRSHTILWNLIFPANTLFSVYLRKILKTSAFQLNVACWFLRTTQILIGPRQNFHSKIKLAGAARVFMPDINSKKQSCFIIFRQNSNLRKMQWICGNA